MPRHDPRAIANEFLQLDASPMNQMKLQKLVYIANGWNLVINDEPLTTTGIEAWDGGPVYRVIWDHLKDHGYNIAGSLLGNWRREPYKADLTDSERQVIRHVWKRYGKYTGRQLSEMTHREGTPWSNAYFGRGRNSILKIDDIKRHFTELALAGRP